MKVDFEITAFIPTSPERIYNAWLNSDGHTGMTGSPAVVSDGIGDQFEAYDEYIVGKNLELEPKTRILQSWRTTEFRDSDEDSLLEILLEAKGEGSLLTIRHSGLPDHGMQYRQGWVDAYFAPMEEYFGKI